MKIHRYLLAGWLGVMGFLSCSQDGQPSSQTKTEQDNDLAARTIRVELTAGSSKDGDYSSNRLRLAQNIESNASASNYGEATSPFMAEKDVKIRIGIRQAGGTAIQEQTLTFKKIAGQNKAKYSGNIVIPASAVGNNFEIAGVLLGEDGGTQFTTLSGSNVVVSATGSTLAVPNASNVLPTKIPYVAKWQALTKNAGGAFDPAVIDFYPSGTLVRFRVKNSTDAPKTLNKIAVKSNALVSKWQYSLAKIGDNTSTRLLKEGQVMSGTTLPTLQEEYSLPTAETVAPNAYSKWYYMWFMPQHTTDAKGKGGVTEISAVSGTLAYTSFKTKYVPPTGNVAVELDMSASTLTGVFHGMTSTTPWKIAPPVTNPFRNAGKLPLAYLAEYDVNTAGTGFTTTHANNDTNKGSFTQAEAEALSISGYHLPLINEWYSVVPNGVNTSMRGTLGSFSYTTSVQTLSEEARFPGESTVETGFTSKYSAVATTSTGTKVGYAIRFMKGDNRYALAYRYEWPGNWMSGTDINANMKISSVWVGSDADDADFLDEVSQESWWTAHASEAVTKTLSAWGYKEPSSQLRYKNSRSLYRLKTESAYLPYKIAWVSGGEYLVGVRAIDLTSYPIPVRLFSDN